MIHLNSLLPIAGLHTYIWKKPTCKHNCVHSSKLSLLEPIQTTIKQESIHNVKIILKKNALHISH